jgi:hypothetical protein
VCSLQVIRNYNGKMLNDIKPRLAKWHPNQSLGDIFLQVVRASPLMTRHRPRFYPLFRNVNAHTQRLLVEQAAFLKAYTQYVTKYNKAIAHITSLKKQMPKFRQFLEVMTLETLFAVIVPIAKSALFTCCVQECAEKANGQDIAALLIQPVQRIPRYQLLLKDLISHSDPEHLVCAGLCPVPAPTAMA